MSLGIHQLNIDFYSNISLRQEREKDNAKEFFKYKEEPKKTTKNISKIRQFDSAGKVTPQIKRERIYDLEPKMIANPEKVGNTFYVTERIEMLPEKFTKREDKLKYFTNKDFLSNNIDKEINSKSTRNLVSTRSKLTGSGKTDNTEDEWILATTDTDTNVYSSKPRNKTRKLHGGDKNDIDSRLKSILKSSKDEKSGMRTTKKVGFNNGMTSSRFQYNTTRQRILIRNILKLLDFFLRNKNIKPILVLNKRAYYVRNYNLIEKPNFPQSSTETIKVKLDIHVVPYTGPIDTKRIQLTKGDKRLISLKNNFSKSCNPKRDDIVSNYNKLKQEFQNYRDEALKNFQAGIQLDQEKTKKQENEVEERLDEALREKREKFKDAGLFDNDGNSLIGKILLSEAKKKAIYREVGQSIIEPSTYKKEIKDFIAEKQNEFLDNYKEIVKRRDDDKEKRDAILTYKRDVSNEVRQKLRDKQIPEEEINELLNELDITPKRGFESQRQFTTGVSQSDFRIIAHLASSVDPSLNNLTYNYTEFFDEKSKELKDIDNEFRKIKLINKINELQQTNNDEEKEKKKQILEDISSKRKTVIEILNKINEILQKLIDYFTSIVNKPDEIKSELGDRSNNMINQLNKKITELELHKNKTNIIDDKELNEKILTIVPSDKGTGINPYLYFVETKDYNEVLTFWENYEKNTNKSKIRELLGKLTNRIEIPRILDSIQKIQSSIENYKTKGKTISVTSKSEPKPEPDKQQQEQQKPQPKQQQPKPQPQQDKPQEQQQQQQQEQQQQQQQEQQQQQQQEQQQPKQQQQQKEQQEQQPKQQQQPQIFKRYAYLYKKIPFMTINNNK